MPPVVPETEGDILPYNPDSDPTSNPGPASSIIVLSGKAVVGGRDFLNAGPLHAEIKVPERKIASGEKLEVYFKLDTPRNVNITTIGAKNLNAQLFLNGNSMPVATFTGPGNISIDKTLANGNYRLLISNSTEEQIFSVVVNPTVLKNGSFFGIQPDISIGPNSSARIGSGEYSPKLQRYDMDSAGLSLPSKTAFISVTNR